MNVSWILPFLQWVLTPALITGAVLGIARLYDPPTRWLRQLKSDIAIASGLPDGPEKAVWQESTAWQGQRLREYQEAFVGWTFMAKWAGLAFIIVPLVLLVIFPPINKPGDRYPLGPADYMMMGMGLLTTVVYAVSLGSGRDFFGRSPRDIILRRRLRRFKRRLRSARRLDKERARRFASGAAIKPKGSRLGFSTQIDFFGPWMRDPGIRNFIGTAGFIAPDIAAMYLSEARGRGVELPPWPSTAERYPAIVEAREGVMPPPLRSPAPARRTFRKTRPNRSLARAKSTR